MNADPRSSPSVQDRPGGPAAAPVPEPAQRAGEELLRLEPIPHEGRGWQWGRRPPAAPTVPAGMATSDQIDAFRELRTRLSAMAEGLGLSQFTTLVAPVAEDAGGSFVARNLAATFTLQGRAALIIECNFRRPSQSEALRATSDSDGLFEFLARTDEERVALPIWPTVIPGLFLIPAGRCEATFAGQIDFLSSSSMKVLLSKVRDYPCNVVLDAPPAIGSPDARILAELADFVVLVVGAGRSTVQDIASAAERFDRKKLAGVAFNQYAGVRRPR